MQAEPVCAMRRLLDAGALKKGQKVLFLYKDKQFSAEIDAEGGLRSEDEHFKARRFNPCSACSVRARIARARSTDGPARRRHLQALLLRWREK